MRKIMIALALLMATSSVGTLAMLIITRNIEPQSHVIEIIKKGHVTSQVVPGDIHQLELDQLKAKIEKATGKKVALGALESGNELGTSKSVTITPE